MRALGRNVTLVTIVLVAAVTAGCENASDDPTGPDAFQNPGGGGEEPAPEELEAALTGEEEEVGGCRQIGPSYVCFGPPVQDGGSGPDVTEEDCAAVQADTSVVLASEEVQELQPDALVYRAIAAGCTGLDPGLAAADIEAAAEQSAELSPPAAALLQVLQVQGPPEGPEEAQVLLETAP